MARRRGRPIAIRGSTELPKDMLLQMCEWVIDEVGEADDVQKDRSEKIFQAHV
jgi:hypothetical protein